MCNTIKRPNLNVKYHDRENARKATENAKTVTNWGAAVCREIAELLLVTSNGLPPPPDCWRAVRLVECVTALVIVEVVLTVLEVVVSNDFDVIVDTDVLAVVVFLDEVCVSVEETPDVIVEVAVLDSVELVCNVDVELDKVWLLVAAPASLVLLLSAEPLPVPSHPPILPLGAVHKKFVAWPS